MKKLYTIAVVLLGIFAFAACEKQDKTPVFTQPESFVLNTPAYVNSPFDLTNSKFVEFSTSQPDYGFTAGVDYTLQISLNNTWEQPEDKKAVPNYYEMGPYTTAKFQADAEEFAGALNVLGNNLEDDGRYPKTAKVYVRLKANLTASGEGLIYSNVVEFPTMTYHWYLPPFDPPKALFLVKGEDFDGSSEFHPTHDAAYLWGMVWLEDGDEFRFTNAKNFDDLNLGYDDIPAGQILDLGGSGVEKAANGAFVVNNTGWYVVSLKTLVEGRSYNHTLTIDAPKVWLTGDSSPDAQWGSCSDDNLFTAPTTYDGAWVSPALAAEGNIRTHVKLDGVDWWKSEFYLVGGEIKFRGKGDEIAGVATGEPGDVVYLKFSDNTGEVKSPAAE